jgi:small ligand-binding sensory domain FIST
MSPTTSTGVLKLASGISTLPDAAKAVEHVCAQCAAGLGTGSMTHLALLFFTSHHIARAEEIARAVRKELQVECLVGISAEGVVGGRTEVERSPGVSLLAARLPGVSLVPFATDEILPYDESTPEGLSKLARGFGADEALRASFLFADPFSVPAAGLVGAMNKARAHARIGSIIGGLASASEKANGNALILDDAVYRAGLVGVSLRGPVRVDTVVSQGCRAVGPTFIVTKARKNVILTLGGRPALQVVRELVESLSPEDQELLKRGLFVGRVIDEYKDRFGRGDFLIRNVVGVEESNQAIAIAEVLRVGQTVQFHLRDARTADEDLALLLDAQQLREPPVGGLLITCNSRGTRLFDRPHHDASAIARAFAPQIPGEAAARGGHSIDPGSPTFPLAGFFGAGEIGPIGEQSFLHGHTACLALFRSEPKA